ncbi:universal stress protein [Nocardioides panacisoli]
MMVTKRILVGYDASAPADDALRWALETGRTQHVPVVAVVVGGTLDMMATNPHGDALMEAEDRQLSARRLMEEVPDVDGEVDLRLGHPAAELAHAAGPGDLIVVGAVGHSRGAGLLMGSVSQELVRIAAGTVVVVRPAAAPEEHRIGVGVDGSSDSLTALEWACARAAATGEHVVALHGFQPSLHADHPGASVRDLLVHDLHLHEQRLAGWTADVRAAYPGVEVTLEAAAVPARGLLTGFSEHASLVVVGAHGHGVLGGLLVGSISQHVLNHARCPVVAVR